MIRTALLNGNNINRDSDFSKYIESISGPGVIEGLEVSASSVAEGYAWISCERSNGETVYPVVYITTPVEISGDGEVYIEVKQSAIDDGELSNEDGTGIAEVKVGTTPSKNAIKLATITGGVVEDNRVFVPKLDNLRQAINTLFASVEDLDDRVEALEESGAVDHLEESALVGELYTLNDTLFKQYTPTLADSTMNCNVSDVAANTQIHIQRIASGVASNELKLKVKMVGSSTQNLKVEVRKGVQVTVTEGVEAYWYGDQVVASGSISYSEISTSYAEKTITLDNEFGGTKGELLDIVVYMDTVNASNYYCVACDSTQYSEGFSYVSVNGSTRTRSKLMPYCISDGFVQSLLSKVDGDIIPFSFSSDFTISDVKGTTSSGTTYSRQKNNNNTFDYANDRRATLFTASFSGLYTFKIKASQNNSSCKFGFGTSTNNILSEIIPAQSRETEYTITINVNAGDTVYVYNYLAGAAYSNISLYIHTYTYSVNIELTKNSNTVGYAKENYLIGDLGIISIFGIIDKKFYVGQTTNTVQTGNITLGNAVGYINIGGYKIPYYL